MTITEQEFVSQRFNAGNTEIALHLPGSFLFPYLDKGINLLLHKISKYSFVNISIGNVGHTRRNINNYNTYAKIPQRSSVY